MATEKAPTSKPSRWKWPARLLLGLGLSLGGWEASHQVITTPYQDIVGVWTVCDGITRDVDPNKVYTEAECADLAQREIQIHLDGIAQCAPVSALPIHQQFAHAHLAYNIGVGAWCKSSLARLIREGQPLAACGRMALFVYAGGKDCRLKQNRCSGLVKRRAFEQGVCEGRILVPGLTS